MVKVQRSSSPSVLVVRLDAIGDALVTVPLVAALNDAGLVTGAVLTRRNAQVFAPRALAHVHLPHDLEGIAAQRYDIALIPSEEPEAYALAYAARIPQRIGFEHGLLGKPFKSLWIRSRCTRTVYRPAGLDSKCRHEAEAIFDLASRLLPGIQPSCDAEKLRPLVVQNDPPPDARIAFQVTEKWLRLGAAFQDVVRAAQLVSEDANSVRFIGAQNESPFVQTFSQASGFTVETFDSLGPWKDAIAASRAIVAPDSGAVHVAGMTGTPVVAFYQSEHFALQTRRWAPWAAANKMLGISGDWPRRAVGALQQLASGMRAV